MSNVSRIVRRAARSVWDWQGFRVLLLIAVVGVTAAWIWAPHLSTTWLDSLQVGDLGEYVQGAALFGAVWVALRDSRHAREERLADEQRQAEHERTQVYGWVAYEEHDGEPGWYATLNNMTPAPVAVWVLRVSDAQSGQEIALLDVAHQLPLRPGFQRFPVETRRGGVDRTSYVLQFADSAGACWQRDTAGTLTAIEQISVSGHLMASSAGGPTGRVSRS